MAVVVPLVNVTATRKPCLLDTDILIDFLRGHESAKALLSKLPEDSAISVLSVAELHVGVRDGGERDALDLLLTTFDVIELTAQIAAQGGLFRRDRGKAHGLGSIDALIAATSIQTKRILITLNVKHFPMLDKAQMLVPYVKPSAR